MDEVPCRVLHAIVGHKFPGYFSNAIRSALLMAPNDDILVVDNASRSPALKHELNSIGAREPRMRVIFRESNDTTRNKKVGGLYDACNEIVEYALHNGYTYLHIMQHDMQFIWWDSTIIETAEKIYDKYPECVNIRTAALPRHSMLSDDIEYIDPKLIYLSNYGLTDTGLYHLSRMREGSVRFGGSEGEHAKRYLDQGLRVFCHPLPTVAPVPWPAVVRSGQVKGHEIQPRHEFLLRPLSPSEISRVRDSAQWLWLEDVCIPWGWTALLPFWDTSLNTIDYWVYRYRDIRAHGLRASWPRWDRRGLADGTPLRRVQRRPQFGLLQVIILPPWHEFRRRIRTSA